MAKKESKYAQDKKAFFRKTRRALSHITASSLLLVDKKEEEAKLALVELNEAHRLVAKALNRLPYVFPRKQRHLKGTSCT